MASPAFAADRPRQHRRTSDAEVGILAATERLLHDTSLAALSIPMILAEADVARGTFYHYFSSKYAVVAALMAGVQDELFATFQADLETGDERELEELLRESLHRVIERWAAHRAVLRAVSEHWQATPDLCRLWLSMFTRFADAVAVRLDRYRADGRAPAGYDGRALATALVHGSERCLYVAGLGVDEDFPDETSMTEPLIQLWVGGLLGRHAAVLSDVTAASPRAEEPPAGEPDGNRALILAVTARLLETTPLSELSVRQVYDAAEIGRTTFYRHFTSKIDIVTTLVQAALDDAYAAFDRTPADQRRHEHARTLGQRLRAMADVWSTHRSVLRAASEGWQDVPELAEIWLGIIDTYGRNIAITIDHERAHGLAPAGVPSRPMAKALAWMTESCMHIAGLGVEPAFPDETTAAGAAGAISLGTIYG